MDVNAGVPVERKHSMLITQRPSLTEGPSPERRFPVRLEPLDPGFGYTLGNSLRRTLLSSIPGAAVTSLRIDGVLHEFHHRARREGRRHRPDPQLKELVVSSEADEPVTMYLRKQGPARLPPPTSRRAGVEVHTSCTSPRSTRRPAGDRAGRRARAGLRAGRAEQQAGQEIGGSRFDSIYSRAEVTYRVEATRVEQRTDFDKLIVDVETSTRSAARRAGQRRYDPGRALRAGPRAQHRGRRASRSARRRAEAADIANFSMPIEEMELTVRSYTGLKRKASTPCRELVSRSEADLLDIP